MKEKSKLFIGYYNKSVVLTYIGIIMSILGIINIMHGYEICGIESVNRVTISMIFLVLAGICDLFDGFIARKCKRTEQEKQFGIQIDSLADIISFVVFPVIILSRMAYRHNLLIVVSSLYILAGVIRLAYFNITTEENKGYFRGLPVTFSAVIIPLVYMLTLLFNINEITNLMLILYTVIAILNILNFKLKKPSGIWYGIFSALAVFVIYGLLIF